jgi:plastocyanin
MKAGYPLVVVRSCARRVKIVRPWLRVRRGVTFPAMSKTFQRALCLAAIAALPLAACGGDDDSSDGGDAEEENGDAVEVLGLQTLEFDPDSITAPAGEITFRLVNDGTVPHTFLIEDHEDDLRLSVGETDEGTITLEEGEYVYYCDVAGHRGAGMEGTLAVGPAEG